MTDVLPDDLPMTPAEVATLFRVGPKTVTRWAEEGKLTSFRTPGGHRRYYRAEVEELAARYRPGGDWVTVAGLAEALGVGRASAWQWVKAGKVPGAVKDGTGVWLIPRATISAMLEGGTP